MKPDFKHKPKRRKGQTLAIKGVRQYGKALIIESVEVKEENNG